ncbi:asparagine synthetase domain-containing protein CG17486 [Chironomus tepperi]|uniref:asparagine synthetase domain-containing protein CG17486 n=1 Tax=Chironomus tepperi TaxID=113505 RepID=UPI00391F94D6
MCGIFAMLFADEQICHQFYKKHIEELLANRGPNDLKIVYENSIFFGNSVLWHQGDSLISQPVCINGSDKILLFNGDLFMDINGSDTLYLAELLKNAQNEMDLIDIFKKITGPFSMIFYFDKSLYFIRDSFGRNSLIMGKVQDSLFLTSVIDHQNEEIEAIEIPPLGLYKINLETKDVELIPYEELTHPYHLEQLDLINKLVNVNLKEQIIEPDWLQPKSPSTNLSFDDIELPEIDENIFDFLLSNEAISKLCDEFINLLTKSMHDRVLKTQSECKNCIGNQKCDHSNISVLFSGGVDCTLLTALAHKFIDKEKPIDLLNVAFEKVSNKNAKIDFNVPDRLTGLDTLNELQNLYPERKWNFIEINITRAELYEHKKKLSSLVYPLSNVLDESLGSAIYFASRGRGLVNEMTFESPCRVILMGSGADELFAGYTRHRNAFKRSTAERDLLTEELELDWIRLPSRNLARDDRVVADNGITVRAPFIEENFVNFARSLKALQRCYPKLPEGIGDKLLLRLCAYKIGLKKCCQFRKRALQFGSRIADKKQSAKDKSKLLE